MNSARGRGTTTVLVPEADPRGYGMSPGPPGPTSVAAGSASASAPWGSPHHRQKSAPAAGARPWGARRRGPARPSGSVPVHHDRCRGSSSGTSALPPAPADRGSSGGAPP
uniref:CalU7 n=1 Tax=Micromonospora echinospora TaxID=1877 RepID=Q8KNI4_MICEC|nr:CalU7 [Micromonospora echinospora]